MSGSKAGAAKARETNLAQDPDFYRRIGSLGGKVKSDKPKGFAYAAAHGLTWHKEAGHKGGTISRRGKSAKEFRRV